MTIGNGVTLRGIPQEDFEFTFNISGTVVAADVGKPMTLDTTADNTAKLAGDGDAIIGCLQSIENRVQEGIVVGTVAMKGCFKFLYTGTAPARGVKVVGSATDGKVKAGAVDTANTTTGAITIGTAVLVPHLVVAVDTTATSVDVLFL